MARVFNILIMKRKNIFFLLLIASALLYGQDNSVTVKLKDGREIPLTSIDEPMALSQIENEAVELAKYLNIFLETA